MLCFPSKPPSPPRALAPQLPPRASTASHRASSLREIVAPPSSTGHRRPVRLMATAAPPSVPAIRLSSGYDMPVVGMGVWRADKGRLGALIKDAVSLGYRHFDCAADYGNEAEVGEALSSVLEAGEVKREELFVTSKLWNSDHAHVRAACEQSLKDLRLDYLDLYLVHFPIATKHTGPCAAQRYRAAECEGEECESGWDDGESGADCVLLQPNHVLFLSLVHLYMAWRGMACDGMAGIGSTSSAMGEDGVLDIDISVPLHEVWRHMEALVKDGLVRSIGIRCAPSASGALHRHQVRSIGIRCAPSASGVLHRQRVGMGMGVHGCATCGTACHQQKLKPCCYTISPPAASLHSNLLPHSIPSSSTLVPFAIIPSATIVEPPHSNYDVYLTRDCLAYSSAVRPAVNQVETHPFFQRASLLRFCAKHGVTLTAHTPLGGGAANEELFKSKSPLTDPVVLVRSLSPILAPCLSCHSFVLFSLCFNISI
ncbi:unnamed protein product [Closterium sp. NIES-54]